MNRKLFCFSLIAIAVAGCTTVNKKQANGDFDYAEKSEAKELNIPSGMSAPKKHSEFSVTTDINHRGSIGKEIDVRAPSLVLPIAASTRVESGEPDAKIWFDQVLDDVPLRAFIYEALKEQLALDNVGLDVIDEENSIYESQWYNREKESGIWLFEEVESTESFRFRYQFEQKTHGRSVSLKVSLVDYMKTDSSGGTKSMALIDQERAEMAMLNEIVSQVDFKYRKYSQENRLMRANQQLVSLGVNADNEPALIVEIEPDLLWSNLPIFFEDYSFTIDDLNESKKVYYVDYVRPSVSLWDQLWGDSLPILEFEDQKYQFAVAKVSGENDKTSVTIKNEQGVVLSSETLEKVFDVLKVALSFRDTF